eukprot:5797601-Prymnesium_polylepis.1
MEREAVQQLALAALEEEEAAIGDDALAAPGALTTLNMARAHPQYGTCSPLVWHVLTPIWAGCVAAARRAEEEAAEASMRAKAARMVEAEAARKAEQAATEAFFQKMNAETGAGMGSQVARPPRRVPSWVAYACVPSWEYMH